MDEEETSGLAEWIESINDRCESVIDFMLDHTGCFMASVCLIVMLLLSIGAAAVMYDSYIHRNQHCVQTSTTYVMSGKVLVPMQSCDEWQNN